MKEIARDQIHTKTESEYVMLINILSFQNKLASDAAPISNSSPFCIKLQREYLYLHQPRFPRLTNLQVMQLYRFHNPIRVSIVLHRDSFHRHHFFLALQQFCIIRYNHRYVEIVIAKCEKRFNRRRRNNNDVEK